MKWVIVVLLLVSCKTVTRTSHDKIVDRAILLRGQ